MTKIKINELKKHLNSLSKQQLEEEIITLVKTYSELHEYYYAKLNPDNEYILDKYKKIIEKEFSPKSGAILRYPIIKKAIKEFGKITKDQDQIIDLMLFTVDCGVDFTLSFADIDHKFYHAISAIYEEAVRLIVKHEKDDFIKWCHRLMSSSQEIGWGFAYDMEEIY